VLTTDNSDIAEHRTHSTQSQRAASAAALLMCSQQTIDRFAELNLQNITNMSHYLFFKMYSTATAAATATATTTTIY